MKISSAMSSLLEALYSFFRCDRVRKSDVSVPADMVRMKGRGKGKMTADSPSAARVKGKYKGKKFEALGSGSAKQLSETAIDVLPRIPASVKMKGGGNTVDDSRSRATVKSDKPKGEVMGKKIDASDSGIRLSEVLTDLSVSAKSKGRGKNGQTLKENESLKSDLKAKSLPIGAVISPDPERRGSAKEGRGSDSAAKESRGPGSTGKERRGSEPLVYERRGSENVDDHTQTDERKKIKPGKKIDIQGEKVMQKAEERKFFRKIYGLTGGDHKFNEVRACVNDMVRDHNISTRRDDVAKQDGTVNTHDYFLRDRTPKLTSSVEVDHTFECQLIAHCIMQTDELHPIIKQLNINITKTVQLEIVRGLLNPIYNIHNCTQSADCGTFNLHLLEKTVNIKKGAAVADFLNRQYSTRPGEMGGPVNFDHYYKNANAVVAHLITSEELAGRMESLLLDVEDPYKNYLLNSQNKIAIPHVHEARMEALVETINQVYDKMIEGNKSR